MTNFKNFSQRDEPVVNRIRQFIKFYFLEQQLGHSASFVSVLTRS